MQSTLDDGNDKLLLRTPSKGPLPTVCLLLKAVCVLQIGLETCLGARLRPRRAVEMGLVLSVASASATSWYHTQMSVRFSPIGALGSTPTGWIGRAV